MVVEVELGVNIASAKQPPCSMIIGGQDDNAVHPDVEYIASYNAHLRLQRRT